MGDIWDEIVESFFNFFSFEWIGDLGETFSGMFENITEFSIFGLVYAIGLPLLIYLFRNQIFVFLKSVPLQILVYLVSAIAGYLIGKGVWDN